MKPPGSFEPVQMPSVSPSPPAGRAIATYQAPGLCVFHADCEAGIPGPNCGGPSQQPCADPQDAIDRAAAEVQAGAPSCQVWVKQGICKRYGKPSLTLVDRVSVYGGFLGGEHTPEDRPVAALGPESLDETVLTVLEGLNVDATPVPVEDPPNYNAAGCAPQIVRGVNVGPVEFDGFLIRHGWSTAPSGAGGGDCNGGGAGMFLEQSALRLRHVVFQWNRSSGQGGAGAALCSSGGYYLDPQDSHQYQSLADCRFENNRNEVYVAAAGAAYLTYGTVERCIFENNVNRYGDGGALFMHGGTGLDPNDRVVVRDSVFRNNVAYQSGGAIWMVGAADATLLMERSIFQDNMADDLGGAVALGGGSEGYTGPKTIQDCLFEGNDATDIESTSGHEKTGGAIGIVPVGRFVLRRNVFRNNTASMGGGLGITDSTSSEGGVVALSADLRVENCAFWGNEAAHAVFGGTRVGGGAMGLRHARGLAWTVRILNSTLAGNSAGPAGLWCAPGAGGLDTFEQSEATPTLEVHIANTIIWGNVTITDQGEPTGGLEAQIRRRSWSCTDLPLAPVVRVSYSDVETDATPLPGPGNLAADPRFADSNSGNLRLRRDSPCVDSGWTGTVDGTHTPTVDLDGYDRPVDATSVPDTGAGEVSYMDMGAYELQTWSLGTVCQDETESYCESGFCVNGICCNEACDGQCDEGCDETGHCLYKPEGTACDDGQYCTVDDTCDGQGQCASGPPRDCMPESPVVCTEYLCDENRDECVEGPAGDETWCDDGDPCTGPDHCDGQHMGPQACVADGSIQCPDPAEAECVSEAHCVQEGPWEEPSCVATYVDVGAECGPEPEDCMEPGRCDEEHHCVPGGPVQAGDDPYGDCPGGQVCDGQGGCMAVLHVKVEGDDGNDGLTWATALATPQGAVTRCQDLGLNPCEVWVAEGTYRARPLSLELLRLASGVHMYGGFAGTEASRSDRDWAEHRAVLDGGWIWRRGWELIPGAVPRVVFLEGVTDVVLDGFEVERASDGPWVRGGGGGIVVRGGSSDVEIANVWVHNVRGAGILVDESDVEVGNALIYGNWVGAGVWVSGSADRRVRFVNVTITQNWSFSGGFAVRGQVVPELVNSILWDNTNYLGWLLWWLRLPCPGWLEASYSDVETTYCVHMGPGSISEDPEFGSGGVGELSGGSPCIDAADDNQAPALDLGHRTRVDVSGVGSSVADMGAYEYQPGAGGPVAAR